MLSDHVSWVFAVRGAVSHGCLTKVWCGLVEPCPQPQQVGKFRALVSVAGSRDARKSGITGAKSKVDCYFILPQYDSIRRLSVGSIVCMYFLMRRSIIQTVESVPRLYEGDVFRFSGLLKHGQFDFSGVHEIGGHPSS